MSTHFSNHDFREGETEDESNRGVSFSPGVPTVTAIEKTQHTHLPANPSNLYNTLSLP